MTNDYFWVVGGMALVTYVPRMLPLVFLKDVEIPNKLDQFLKLIPYTLLSALIFPSVLTATHNSMISLIALFICAFFAYKKWNPVFVVLVGIGSVYLLTLLGL